MLVPYRDDGSLATTPFPPLFRLRRHMAPPRVEDILAAVQAAVREARLPERVRPGMRIALGVGSRGISRLDELAVATVRALQDLGAIVFVVPAMGSHGAGTAEGQREVLARLGVSEERLGVPVRATMEVDQVGLLPEGLPVYMDRLALQADGVVVLGRTKPHTDFRGPIESGAAKMIAIGLGKRAGAQAIHSHGLHGLRELMPRAARLMVRQGRVLGAIQVVENARDEVAIVAGLGSEDIAGPGEERLQARSKELLGRLPFKELDALVIDLMGKEISGCGMDPNVLGRLLIQPGPEPNDPHIYIVCVLGITPVTHGNVTGIGLADVTTWQLYEQIDVQATYVNTLTSGICAVQRAKLPMALPDARHAVAASLRMCGRPDIERARVARIRSTLHLTEIHATREALDQIDPSERVEVLSGPEPWPFGADGSLPPVPLP